MELPAAPRVIITAEQSEANSIFIGRYFAGVAAVMVGFFVLSVLVCMDVVPRVTTFDKIFWGVLGTVFLLIAALIVCMLLRDDSPCNRRHKINKRATC